MNRLLRDHRTGEQHPIDPALFDILHDLRVATGTASPFQVISGYRSPSTNGMLRERSSGVASGSLHLQGRAVDIRLADMSSAALRDAAIRLHRGGVGYYATQRLRAHRYGQIPHLVAAPRSPHQGPAPRYCHANSATSGR